MNKVAQYLQEHILGEVVTNEAILDAMSQDASVLEIRPEMVIYPRVTNDIRKSARFAWQLAEKGHIVSLTARGSGTDATGGAIGRGAIVNTKAHMNALLELDPKQKLFRVQPGVLASTMVTALGLQGMGVAPFAGVSSYTTIGGMVGRNDGGVLAGSTGTMLSWVHQLEVVLANGDILQTERISKRELNKRKGMQTFEGEIYRSIDGLIEDNKQLIAEHIGTDTPDKAGYSAIAKVKQRDGSFDLTPLFVGSQGTLGIVSELILKCEFMSMHTGVAVAGFNSKETARDALDKLRGLEPAFLNYYDGEFFETAAKRGKKYDFYNDVDGTIKAVVVLGFNDFREHARRKKLKKVAKLLDSLNAMYQTADGEDAAALAEVMEVTSYTLLPEERGASAPPLFDGVYIPAERFEEFSRASGELAARHHVELPLHLDALSSIVNTRPVLYLHKVGDKQKIFKLLDEFANLVASFGGCLVARGGEGRVKARFAYAELDTEVKELYSAIKATFDPYGILNAGVKQDADLRDLVMQLRKDYDTAAFKDEVAFN